MSVSLQKGGNVSLKKANGSPLRRAVVACGWDANPKRLLGKAYDLDLSAAGIDASGKVPTDKDGTDRENRQEWFIWANHRQPGNGSVQFMHDNRTGEGEGDDEEIRVDLEHVPEHILQLRFGVVIWRAHKRRQTFSKVKKAYIRIYDEDTGEELVRYSLTDDFGQETFVVFGELYRRNGEWKFRAIGQGYTDAAVYRHEVGIVSSFETEYARTDLQR